MRHAWQLAEQLDSFARTGSYPQGAVLVIDDPMDGLGWRGLVREGDTAAWKKLVGPAALDTAYTIVMDVDFRSGSPRVRYVVAAEGGTAYPLSDAAGHAWFDGAGSGLSAAGTVKLSGVGRVTAIAGRILRAEKGSVVIVF